MQVTECQFFDCSDTLVDLLNIDSLQSIAVRNVSIVRSLNRFIHSESFLRLRCYLSTEPTLYCGFPYFFAL